MRASTQVQQCGESIADLLHLVGAGYSELANESLFRGGFDLVHHGDSSTATTADGDEQRKLCLIVRAGDRHYHKRAAKAVERLAREAFLLCQRLWTAYPRPTLEKQIPIISFPQQAIRAKCFHPSGAFVEFKKEDVEQSIPDRFEQQVAGYPDRIAVKTKHHKLTYEMLNQAANRVAHAILRERDRTDETIALLMENDAPMMAAILGVLKAGKIYVPLDPSYPRARINYMLEDSQTTLIVTNDKNSSLAKELAQKGRKWINTDELDANLSSENLGLSLSPDTLAYIIYTSGSTGRPKGIVQNHRNVLHDLMGFTNTLCISAHDRLSLLHSCSFSAARLDIFGALLNGASLFPFDLNQEGMANLANWLVQEAITIYHWIPTASRHFISTLTRDEAFLKVRLMVLGSEPVYKRDMERYKKYFPQSCIFVNRLGAGETLTFRMYFASHQTQITGSNVPVGYAVEDKEILLRE